MKKIFTLIILTAFVFVLHAQSSGTQAYTNPKATNYKEVLKGIEYPQVCREKGIEGTVLVVLNINENGTMTNYKFKSAPCDDLQTAVENSLSKLTFEPAKNPQGQAVRGKLTLPVQFKLSI